MASPIAYFVNMRGYDFNRLLNPDDQMPQAYFDKITPGEGEYIEARLQGVKRAVAIDLTGEWTALSLPYPYGALLVDEPTVGKIADFRKQISEWECRLRELTPSSQIFRLDDFLMSKWFAAVGIEVPNRDSETMHAFIEWLGTQDKNYWCQLPDKINSGSI